MEQLLIASRMHKLPSVRVKNSAEGQEAFSTTNIQIAYHTSTSMPYKSARIQNMNLEIIKGSPNSLSSFLESP